jgi:hypothetical protein
MQSLFAGTVAAIATPIAAPMNLVGNMVVSGAAGATTTLFNNSYYGELNSLYYSGAMWALGGALGYSAAMGVGKITAATLPRMLYPGGINPNLPILLQGTRNMLPGNITTTTGAAAGSWPAFIPGKELK